MRNARAQIYLFLFLSAGLVSGCAARVNGPGIHFSAEKYDFGSLAAGTPVNHTFEFTNNGTETLFISEVVPDCGCTTAGDFDKEVLPGKTGKIPVTLNTQGFSGQITKSIDVRTNVPDRKEISLVLEGTVKTNPPTADSAGGLADGLFLTKNGGKVSRIQSGETLIGSSPAASKQATVTFDTAFSGTPKVIATVRNDPAWDTGDTFAVTVRKISNTQFVINIVRVDQALPWNQYPLLEWMAWE